VTNPRAAGVGASVAALAAALIPKCPLCLLAIASAIGVHFSSVRFGVVLLAALIAMAFAILVARRRCHCSRARHHAPAEPSART
jgi:hypothetical protein